MRLIDADALADALFEKRRNYPQWVADTICNMPMIDTDDLLKEQDAVDPVSDPYVYWLCGSCGKEIDYRHKYCPWCGKQVKWE